MPKFDFRERSRDPKQQASRERVASDELVLDKDLVMEQILHNINSTPLGQVLKKIACLPEVRREKVLGVRKQLTEGKYDLNGHLDAALEKVLEDLTTQ